MSGARSGLTVSGEQADQWGGQAAVRMNVSRPKLPKSPAAAVPAAPAPAADDSPTGIDYTQAELACLGLKSEWHKAADTFFPNKPHRGRKVIDIARRRDGLKYLAWLLAKMQKHSEQSRLRETLETFFADERVQKALKG